jgi:hypothetical protein
MFCLLPGARLESPVRTREPRASVAVSSGHESLRWALADRRRHGKKSAHYHLIKALIGESLVCGAAAVNVAVVRWAGLV